MYDGTSIVSVGCGMVKALTSGNAYVHTPLQYLDHSLRIPTIGVTSEEDDLETEAQSEEVLSHLPQ